MITTTELVERTGLNVKTLTRWAEKGILPTPRVGTHPSGRGKIGYWPEWTADFCTRLRELRAEGIGLEEAANKAMLDRYEAVDAEFYKQAQDDIRSRNMISTPEGGEFNLVELLRGLIARELRSSMISSRIQRTILGALDDAEFLSGAIHEIQVGYAMFLTFNGERTRAWPDFLLPAASGQVMKTPKPFFALPLTPLYHEILRSIGLAQLIEAPTAEPASTVWMTQGKIIREYHVMGGGEFGFQLYSADTKIVGEVREDGQKYYLEAPPTPEEKTPATPSPPKPKRTRGRK